MTLNRIADNNYLLDSITFTKTDHAYLDLIATMTTDQRNSLLQNALFREGTGLEVAMRGIRNLTRPAR